MQVWHESLGWLHSTQDDQPPWQVNRLKDSPRQGLGKHTHACMLTGEVDVEGGRQEDAGPHWAAEGDDPTVGAARHAVLQGHQTVGSTID